MAIRMKRNYSTGRGAYSTSSVARELDITRAIFRGAGLLTGAYLNQLAMYSLSTRCRAWISRRFTRIRFQFFARYQKALSDVCSHSRQQTTTMASRTEIENQLRL